MPKATRSMYAQATTTGNPSGHVSDESRFGSRVKVLPSGCWSFRGDLDSYHQFMRSTVDGKRQGLAAHRFAYETLVGPIPEGHHLHHVCENKGCVNPAHLEPLTPADHAAAHKALRSEVA